MANDPVLVRFKNIEGKRTKLHNLISYVFSNLYMDQSESTGVKDFSIFEDHFIMDTVNSWGKEILWKGFINENGMYQCLSFRPDIPGIYVCFVGMGNIASQHTDEKILCPDSSDNQDGEDGISLYPFPYYENMPQYEKFLIFKAILGTKRYYSRDRIIDKIYTKCRHMSLGVYGDNLYRMIEEDVRTAIDSNILVELNGEFSVRSDALTSSRSFLAFYYRYYEKLYKTTLYDF
ncbi:hypothetical protein ACNF42_05235 [Cuniculiplasma sp. SKW3]|uniref:hypothetical protein n=1 Tax=unclassified Cuniculiplasma TaxID=2619706 RepID=UPI003FD61D7E